MFANAETIKLFETMDNVYNMVVDGVWLICMVILTAICCFDG